MWLLNFLENCDATFIHKHKRGTLNYHDRLNEMISYYLAENSTMFLLNSLTYTRSVYISVCFLPSLFFLSLHPQACSCLLSICAFLPVNPKNASHPNTGSHPHHQQVSGLHCRLAGELQCSATVSVLDSLVSDHMFSSWSSCFVFLFESFPMQLLTSSPFMWLLALSGLVRKQYSCCLPCV